MIYLHASLEIGSAVPYAIHWEAYEDSHVIHSQGSPWASVKPQQPPGAAKTGSAHDTRRTAAGDKVPRTAGPPRPHTAPKASGKRAPAARPKGRVVGGGRAPDPGRPTPRQEAAPPGHPHVAPQRARARAVWLETGPQARSPRTHSQWVVGPGRTPEQTRGRGWESARPRTPHTRARGDPPGYPHAAPTARRGAPCGVGDGSAPDLRRPSQWWKAPPRGRPSTIPTASNASPQGRTLWGRCWVPTPAPTASGTHGSRNPGSPLQRTGGPGRDSA